MKEKNVLNIIIMVSFISIISHAQNRVNRSLFNADFSYSKNADLVIMSKPGQNFVGVSENSSSLITSGYFAGYSSMLTDVNNDKGEIPKKFELSQNYPNPFNPATRIKYVISSKEHVTLKIYDVLGREITTLVNEEQPAGKYEVSFHADNLASGIYLYVLKAGSFYKAKKLVLLK